MLLFFSSLETNFNFFLPPKEEKFLRKKVGGYL